MYKALEFESNKFDKLLLNKKQKANKTKCKHPQKGNRTKVFFNIFNVFYQLSLLK